MDSNIKISFIIPCHNLEEYIKPLLCSLRGLNLKNIKYEIIFILDDCTDNTLNIIMSETQDMNKKIFECNVHSCGLARNIGLDNATGEYIWFLDGDDWIIYPNVLQECLPLLDNYQWPLIQLPFISNYFNREYFSMVWQYIYRRSFIGGLRFTSIQPNEDVEFNTKLFASLKQINKFKIPVYFYNYNRPGSNMTKYRKQKSEISVVEI